MIVICYEASHHCHSSVKGEQSLESGMQGLKTPISISDERESKKAWSLLARCKENIMIINIYVKVGR